MHGCTTVLRYMTSCCHSLQFCDAQKRHQQALGCAGGAGQGQSARRGAAHCAPRSSSILLTKRLFDAWLVVLSMGPSLPMTYTPLAQRNTCRRDCMLAQDFALNRQAVVSCQCAMQPAVILDRMILALHGAMRQHSDGTSGVPCPWCCVGARLRPPHRPHRAHLLPVCAAVFGRPHLHTASSVRGARGLWVHAPGRLGRSSLASQAALQNRKASTSDGCASLCASARGRRSGARAASGRAPASAC
jgi:hypothetical protein